MNKLEKQLLEAEKELKRINQVIWPIHDNPYMRKTLADLDSKKSKLISLIELYRATLNLNYAIMDQQLELDRMEAKLNSIKLPQEKR